MSTHALPVAASLALSLLLAAAALTGCDQATLEPLSSVPLTAPPQTRAASLTLRPALLDALSSRADASIAGLETLVWQEASVDLTLADGRYVTLSPLDTTFTLDGVSLTLEAGRLVAALAYTAPPVRASMRLQDGDGTRFCNVEVDLQPRTLTLAFVPDAGSDRQPRWRDDLSQALVSAAQVTHALVGACEFDVDAIDWATLSSLITAQLSSAATATLQASASDALLRGLALPGGGLLLRPTEAEGFFAPGEVRLATPLTAAPVEGQPAFGVDPERGVTLDLDLGVAASAAPCAQGLRAAPTSTPAPLAPHDAPAATPAQGLAYDMLLRLDEGALDALLIDLLEAGYGCADLTLTRDVLDAALPELFAQLEPAALTLGDAARLRLRPTAAARLSVRGPRDLAVDLDGVRVEVYGELEGVLVRLLVFEVAWRAEVSLVSATPGAASLRVEQLATDVLSADLSFFDDLGAAVDVAALAGPLGRWLIASLSLETPRALGLPLEPIELAAEAGAVLLFLRLHEP